ncbi:group II intron reverse transcriptase/maturase [Desulfohalobiaceae bacterium Ax17]|uniref:group II intron reverse transcriptase/maturase n=1 Tax=Desulfovulcanus ferrireducens TaxID=2831190 RepID=UPI00207B9B22|nr:group II intron reverse transcriptase/maturase [Desulfovulcanus ferrireducens]MBT8763178.1 group II intron reverse transcriptase/maturase [Desulfovulcanus ferrireducens]
MVKGRTSREEKVSMSSEHTLNPTGGVLSRRVMEEPASNLRLLERILSNENIGEAWKRVRANKGAPGIDGITVEEFPDAFRDLWPDIRASILTGEYTPSPVLRVEIPKPDSSCRPLGIPTVLDRLIQQAIAQVLGPIFDPEFSKSSCGFRPGRSAHDGVRQVKKYIRQGYKIAVDLDLAKFFDRVNHDVLMNRVSRRVPDKRVLSLIGKYLRAGVMVRGRLQATLMGVPQGGPLSPLLANILLDDLDKELEQRGHRFSRYADDLIILVKSLRAGERVMTSICRFLENKLKLAVNEQKSKVAPVEECSFLGFVFIRGKIRWSEKSYQKFKRQIRLLTGRSWFVSMEYRYRKLAEYVRGWMNYYGISEYYRPIPEIDEWLRRRIRMCYWKQWRYVRTKVRNLLKLGTSKRQAILTALSRKGPWHLARTLAAQSGMTNKWLYEQGLISVKEQWVKIHYPATAR